MIGGFGEAEVFSFHATKFLNTFEGGAVATNNTELAEKLRLMRNFGFAGYDRVIYLGMNGKMTEVSAAMGLTSLESIDESIGANRRNYEAYRDNLSGIPGVRVTTFDEEQHNNYQYVVVDVDDKEAGLTRDELVTVLHRENVLARRYFYPACHRMEPYASSGLRPPRRLIATEALTERLLSLPTGTAVSQRDVEIICRIIRAAMSFGPSMRERLASIG